MIRNVIERRPLQRWVSIFIVVFICGFYPQTRSSFARSPSLGAGIQIGAPTGLCLQVPLTSASALNASINYNLLTPRIEGHADQIFLKTLNWDYPLFPYFGWGARLRLASEARKGTGTNLALRAPLGIEIGENALRGFAEIAPAASLIPVLLIDIQGALGIRYHW